MTMQRRRFGMGLMVGLLLMVTGFLQPAEAADQITVYAAASVTNVVQDLAALYENSWVSKQAQVYESAWATGYGWLWELVKLLVKVLAKGLWSVFRSG